MDGVLRSCQRCHVVLLGASTGVGDLAVKHWRLRQRATTSVAYFPPVLLFPCDLVLTSMHLCPHLFPVTCSPFRGASPRLVFAQSLAEAAVPPERDL